MRTTKSNRYRLLILMAALTSGCSLGEKDLGVVDGRDGTVPVVNFSNAQRFYSKAFFDDANVVGGNANNVIGTAQILLPNTVSGTEMQSSATVLAVEQLAIANSVDMVDGELNRSAAARRFLQGIPTDRGKVDINPFIDRVGFSLWGRQVNGTEMAMLNELYGDVFGSVAGSNNQKFRMALIYVTAAMAASPSAVSK